MGEAPFFFWGQRLSPGSLSLERFKESSALGDSYRASCSEAPHTGAAGQYQVEQGMGETPLIGEEHLLVSMQGMGEAPFSFWGQHPSPSSLSVENFGVLAEKVGTLFFRIG
jgi:hypothetical protein